MSEYTHLTQQQIDFITKHYANQETADDIKPLLTKLGVENYLLEFEDGTADLVIRNDLEDNQFFSNFCKSPTWLTPNIQAFGSGVETAIDTLNNVLSWTTQNNY